MHLVSSYGTKNVSDESVKSAGLKLFFTYKANESMLQALLLSHYKLISGHLAQYLSGLMRVSHCFSYLNKFTEFREFFLIYTHVTEHKTRQLFFPKRLELTFQFEGKSIARQVKTLQCLDVNVLYPLHANHIRIESQLLQRIVASRFHLKYTLLTSWRSS